MSIFDVYGDKGQRNLHRINLYFIIDNVVLHDSSKGLEGGILIGSVKTKNGYTVRFRYDFSCITNLLS